MTSWPKIEARVWDRARDTHSPKDNAGMPLCLEIYIHRGSNGVMFATPFESVDDLPSVLVSAGQSVENYLKKQEPSHD